MLVVLLIDKTFEINIVQRFIKSLADCNEVFMRIRRGIMSKDVISEVLMRKAVRRSMTIYHAIPESMNDVLQRNNKFYVNEVIMCQVERRSVLTALFTPSMTTKLDSGVLQEPEKKLMGSHSSVNVFIAKSD